MDSTSSSSGGGGGGGGGGGQKGSRKSLLRRSSSRTDNSGEASLAHDAVQKQLDAFADQLTVDEALTPVSHMHVV